MGLGLGGKSVNKAVTERDIVDQRIKDATGFTPGGQEYANEYAKYIKDPESYGVVKAAKKNISPERQKAIAYRKVLGEKVGADVNHNQGIKNKFENMFGRL